VDFNKTSGTSGSPDWRTIVVGGLGKGGRGYYALDVTDTKPTDEATLANRILWEFPNATTPSDVAKNVGYSFGKPIITKTKAHGWVVLVASGYNNGADTAGDGKGYLFVLNARTGELIKAISTGAGASDTPSGLAHLAGYAENVETDNTVQYVYGGDVRGNVWRFNLTDPKTSTGWTVHRLATLVDASGNFQPITTEPELGKIKANGVDRRMIMIGTGMLLGDKDIPGTAGQNTWATQTQTMYGLVDDLSVPSGSNAVIQPLRASLQQQVFNTIGDAAGTRNATQLAVDYATKKGWYIDFPASGERLNTAPTLGAGALVFTTNVPTPNLCTLGGSAYINILDYRTGGYLALSQSPSSTPFAKGMASAPVLVRLRTGGIVGLTQGGCKDCVVETPVLPKPTAGTTKRKSWRELLL
jgi:type IV pilus assembly protein PilY1